MPGAFFFVGLCVTFLLNVCWDGAKKNKVKIPYSKNKKLHILFSQKKELKLNFNYLEKSNYKQTEPQRDLVQRVLFLGLYIYAVVEKLILFFMYIQYTVKRFFFVYYPIT